MYLKDINAQVDVFNIFHDGTLNNLQLDEFTNVVAFEIDCEYIVELLVQGQSKLYGKFKNCKEIFFKDWDKGEVITSEVERRKY